VDASKVVRELVGAVASVGPSVPRPTRSAGATHRSAEGSHGHAAQFIQPDEDPGLATRTPRGAATAQDGREGSVALIDRYRFPPEVILLAARWYLRYGLSCRDVEELLAERGVVIDHWTIESECGQDGR
jgi:hypothetical protein